MSVADLLQRLQSMGPEDRFDVPKIREEIHDLYQSATDAEREVLMRIYKSVMDMFEQNMRPEDLPKMRKVREQDYNLLIITESRDSDGNISPVKYLAATSREVAAGRMSPDDPTHRLALAGQLLVAPPPKPKKPGLLQKLFGR